LFNNNLQSAIYIYSYNIIKILSLKGNFPKANLKKWVSCSIYFKLIFVIFILKILLYKLILKNLFCKVCKIGKLQLTIEFEIYNTRYNCYFRNQGGVGSNYEGAGANAES